MMESKYHRPIMKHCAAHVLLTVCLLWIINPQNAYSQSDSIDYDRLNHFSVGAQGGLATGNMNLNTKFTGVYGVNVRYAFNPLVSLQANATIGEFISDNIKRKKFDPSFTNSYQNFNLQGHFNLYQIKKRDQAPFGFSIYPLVGVGLISNDVETNVEVFDPRWEGFMGEDNTDTALYYQFDMGTRIKLSPRFDLFAQFEYNVTNNDRMDGFKDEPLAGTILENNRNDHFVNYTAGIQLKLGSSSRRHAEWHWTPPPPPPEPEPEPEPEPKTEELEERVEEVEETLEDKNRKLDELRDKIRDIRDITDVERVDEGVLVTFDNTILFDFDSARLRTDAIVALDSFAEQLRDQDQELTITVEGHTCNIGSEFYNQDLSERRASVVARYLIDQNIDPSKISSIGKGLTQPRFDNSTSEGREKNRRVEILIEN